jgi:hypothetical protein
MDSHRISGELRNTEYPGRGSRGRHDHDKHHSCIVVRYAGQHSYGHIYGYKHSKKHEYE